MELKYYFNLLFAASCVLAQFSYSNGMPTDQNAYEEVPYVEIKDEISNPSFSLLNPFSYLNILMPTSAPSTPTTDSTTTIATTTTTTSSPLGIFGLGLGLDWFGGSAFGASQLTTPTPATTVSPDDRCKAPLKHLISNLVVKIAEKVVSYQPLATATAKKVQSDMAGAMTDTIIENGLKEDNIAGVGSELIGAQFKYIPYLGGNLAAIAESLAKKTISIYLQSLCKMINCCFQ